MDKIIEATAPIESRLNVAFDPISPVIVEKILRIKGTKNRTEYLKKSLVIIDVYF